MRITVLYDNERVREDMNKGWGFSALIDDDVLFDTGGNGLSLVENIYNLDVNPRSINTVVFSHGHGDHTGGLTGLLEENKDITIYAPSQSLAERLRRSVPETVEVIASIEPTEIRRGIITTGGVGGRIREQGLVCDAEKGAFLVTGCAHPGLVNLLNEARKLEDLKGVIGGFHGFSKLEALKDLDFISPCHCTRKKKEIKERFPEKYVKCGAGLIVEG